ncbi:LysR substrate-binding domain-containing protein [Aquabacter cavernae]|uniref:LysR substrate-binding domain-containing protein n=1 Tax=Aquabacter cavernae TaxID=2496029 RepID=UPI000F8E76BC|nr:LysR substrate-binding domain-containing protein [Aquabacter cavernae]
MPATLPSLRGLAALQALARHKRHKAAAQALGISRSALSHRIDELERELGAALTARTGRVSMLTDDGVALLSAMGDALERIEAAVAPLQRRRAQVRLSTVNTLAANWLLPRLPGFQRAHPHVEMAILTTQRVADLEAEGIDCAIRHGRGEWPGVTARLLFRETLVPAIAPGVLAGTPSAWPVIRARTRFRDWSLWWQAAGFAGAPPEGGMVVENRAQALEAALAGAGVVLTDARFIAPHLASGRLRALGTVAELEEGYYFVRPPAARNPRILAELERWLVAEGEAPTPPDAPLPPAPRCAS